MAGTADTIGWGLELPAPARRRFRAASGCVLADVGRKSRAGDDGAGWHPAAKVAALCRADLADNLAWRYEYERQAWGYAALRWLLVDPGAAVGDAGQSPGPEGNAGTGEVARLRAATAVANVVAALSDVERARQALVRQLCAVASHVPHERCGTPVNRELLAAMAEATLLAGRLTYACWPSAALAQAYFVQALALAQACGDRQLGGEILCAMSEQAARVGQLEEARNLVTTVRNAGRGVASPEPAAFTLRARA